MGGSSKSSQKSEGDLAFNNIDYSQGGGPSPLKNLNIGRGNNLSGANFNVEVTDGGAFAVAGKALDSNTAVTGKALDFGKSTLAEAIGFVSSANKQAQEAVKDTNQQFTNKFSEFANRQSSSSDQRVQDMAKWAVMGVVGLTAWNTWNARKK